MRLRFKDLPKAQQRHIYIFLAVVYIAVPLVLIGITMAIDALCSLGISVFFICVSLAFINWAYSLFEG